MSRKNAFIANQKNSLAETLRTSLKATFLRTKTSFAHAFLRCPQKNSHFHEPKVFLSHKPFLLPSKAILFCPPSPILTALNLLFAKNTAVLLLFALILCCKAGASHRFKSLPAIPSEVTAFRKTGYLMMAAYFSENHVSTGDLNRPRSPEVRKPLACFLVLFARRKKNVKTSLLQEAPRCCKP